jgi:hypothetical protein
VGGLDLDAAILDHLGVRLAPDDPRRWQLYQEVRAAKEQLSRSSTAVVRVPGSETDALVMREEFETLARPWLERTVALTAATLFRTGLCRDQVAAVLLVGGSSRIPLVATLLHQQLGIAPTVLDQPELVVAEGSLRTVAAVMPMATVVPVPPPAPVSPAPPPALAPAAAASLPPPATRRRSGGDLGPVICRITVNGKVIAQVTECGCNPAPECSGIP